MKQQISQLIDGIKNMTRWASVSKVNSDSAQFPTTQVSANGKTSNVLALFPYGLFANLPKNAMVMCLAVSNQEENKVGIGSTPDIRFKGLKEGEVVVGNPLTQVKMFFDKDGNVTIDVPKGNATVNVTQGTTTIDCPRVVMTGNLDVEGDITDNYKTNANSIRGMREIYDGHDHPENDSGGPTDDPNQKMG